MSAAMKLLKDGEAATEQTEVTEEGTEETVIEAPDFTKMKVKELNAFVKEHEIEIEGWEDMGAAAKRKALQALVVDDGEGEGGEGGEGAPDDAEEPEEELVKSKEAPKPKSKALAKDDTKVGEVLPPDPLTKAAADVEKIKTEKEAHKQLRALIDDSEYTAFKIGGLLAKCQAEDWSGSYKNFREFVKGETTVDYRKALYLISIYNTLVELGIPYDKVSAMGWTKLKEILSVLTAANVDAWVKKALGLTTLQLIAEVKAAKNPASSKEQGVSDVPNVTTKTFKLHDDQRETVDAALAKAKDESSGTNVDSVALEYICLDFLGTGANVKGVTLVEMIGSIKAKHENKAEAVQEIFEAFEEHFPDVELTVDLGSEE